jgi:glutamate decarboxylase
MPLHKADFCDHFDDVFASNDLDVTAPKLRLPEHQMEAKHAYQIISDELMLDGNSRLNMATFCGTWMEDEVRRLMNETFDKNMVDRDEYPQTAEIERRCVHMIADLWNAPDADKAVGTSTVGSSEACQLAGMAMKWRWRNRRKAEGKSIEKPNIVMGVNVQVCWHKFARYWDVEERLVPMAEGRYIISAEEVLKLCDENTIGVVAILGSTFTGQYEPVKEIAQALDSFQAETGHDIPVHVDGASGAMVAPFIQPELEWDFRLDRVVSINTSGHKYGLAPLGVGWVAWRDAEYLPDDLIFNVNYLGGDMPDLAINFSRPGGQVCCQYYNFLRLGKQGYAKIQQACQNVALYLSREIAEIGPFEIIHDGSDIPVLSWRVKGGGTINGHSLFDLSERMRNRGWQVPSYTLPRNLQDTAVQRIVVRHGFSKDLARALLVDLKECVALFQKYERHPSMGEEKKQGFTHL